MSSLPDPAEELRTHGLQVTAQRIAVLRAVASAPHTTAEGVAAIARAEIGAISKQSVYDTLTLLVDRGVVRRIQPAGSPALYEDRTGDNHHHLICRDCGHVADVDCAVGSAPCLTPASDLGFQVDEAEVAYLGRCPDCQVKHAEHDDNSTNSTQRIGTTNRSGPKNPKTTGSTRSSHTNA